MSSVTIEDVTDQLAGTDVSNNGVSFKGKSLKLNSKEDCKEVVEAINTCKDLNYLDLEGNTLGVEAAEAIGVALQNKKELKRALWRDMFTGRLKTEIPQALVHLGGGLALAGACLSELDLSDNAFGPIGVKGLAGLLDSEVCFTLQELRLNNNGLGISGGKILAEALLRCHSRSSAAGKALALKVFIAGRNRLENDGAKALAKVFETLGTLEEIAMPQNGIYHVGIAALSKAIAKNPNLKVLNLNDNTLTAKGAAKIAEALPELQKLRVLNLGDCLLKTKGAWLLAAAINEGHRELKEFHLGSNEIKPSGGMAVATAMRNKDCLVQLDLNGNQFGKEGKAKVRDELICSNRIDTLGSLSDDEDVDSDASDDEEDDDDGGGDESTNSGDEDDEREDEEKKDGPEKKRESAPPAMIPVTVSKVDSVETDIKDTVAAFLLRPSVENFNRMGRKVLEEYLVTTKEAGVSGYVDQFIPVLIKLSSLSQVSNEAREISLEMYQQLFLWARCTDQVMTVNNALCVHLGLIKSEDKTFKINWNVDGCVSVLRIAIQKGFAPAVTHDILECFLEKQLAKMSLKPTEITLS